VGQAEALVNWFRSGRFTYTLTPPATAPGSNPLVSFLTQTHAGDCEQFAGAYAVLARSLGLPTRVVVGFTAGRYAGPGEVTVKGADAHAWPQVYLGPTAGWVSFEPTPQQPRGELAPEGVVGPSGVQTAPPPTVGPPPTLPSRSTLPTTPATSVSQTTLPSVTAAAPGLGGLWWTLIGIGTLLVVALVAIALVRRRRRSPAGRTPGQVALLAQSEVRRAFHAAGFECPSWQPLSLFIESLSAPPHGGGSAPSAVREQCDSLIADGVTVAQAADAALFDPVPTDETGSRAAYDAAIRVRQGLRDEEVRRGLFSDRAVDTRV
jgi:hypothetical protein